MNWTGITWVSAMITAFLVAVFSIIINVHNGVKNCSGSLVESAQAYGATNSQVLFKVILPASLPSTMLGLRLGLSRAIEGVIIAEMIFTVVGLGGMIDASADQLQLTLSYSLIIILAIITISLSEGMKFVSRKVLVGMSRKQWFEIRSLEDYSQAPQISTGFALLPQHIVQCNLF